MKLKISESRVRGMTLLEVVVVIFVLAFLAGLVLPSLARPRRHRNYISCINNLKQVGTAYRVWENDNGDKYPMQQSEALGGMQGLLSNTISAGPYAYLTYAIMANELGQSPRVLICSADERIFNTNFYWGASNAPIEKGYTWPKPEIYGSFDNTNVSYFCGVGASDLMPQSILGGDRNLGVAGNINTKTGDIITPDQDLNYGISGTTASPDFPCGADAVINTNGTWSFAVVSGGGGYVGRGQAVGWSAKMHSQGNVAGAGNILLGDGSAQQCTSAGFRQTWLVNASDLGNFATNDNIHSVAHGDIRLLFP